MGDEDEDEDGDGDGEQVFDTRSGSPSTWSAGASGSHHGTGRSEQGNSEEGGPGGPYHLVPTPDSRLGYREGR